MAQPSTSDFMKKLNKIYFLYTGIFVGFTILLGVLEQMDVPNKIIGYLFVFMTIGVYALIGIISRTAELSEYYVAGRRVPAFYNGMATGADWMSAASFISMAGGLYLQGYNGLAYVLGWTGGYVLVATLLAPYLRKFGQFTVPDFLGARYEGNVARVCGIVVLLCASFTYVVAQVFGVGIITSRFLGMSFELSVFVGLVGILVCSMLGGMKAVTWTQVAQYIILITAYLIPVIWLSTKIFGFPIPELAYGRTLSQIADLEKTIGVIKPHVGAFLDAKGQYSNVEFRNFFALVLCLMVGTASLPHILMRYFTTPNVRDARKSVGWSIFFIFLLYFTAPAYAAFAKLEVYSHVIGQPIASLPEWVANWSKVAGMLTIKDANADGILQLAELTLNQDIIVLATPEIAGLPYVISGLVAAGGLAAALSTADGLLLAISNALSHDVYYKMINPKASAFTRLSIARGLLIVVAVIAAATASTRPSGIIQMVAWAFSIAAAGLFPALVLGIWWKRTTSIGACLGMISGLGVCLFYLIGTRYYPMWWIATFGGPEVLASLQPAMDKLKAAQEALTAAGASATDELKAAVTASAKAIETQAMAKANWWGLRNISAGIFGIPAAFVVTILVSLVTRAPSKEMQDFIDSVRVPVGDVLDIEALRKKASNA
ncbi:MAG: sodium:solute symporter family protein [Alphaproteobacteria bacterium]